MSKLISFAGVSRVDGVLKFRGANDVKRIDQLRKLGDTDVEMLFLGKEMSKSQAAKELLARNFANGRADIDALLVAVASDDNPFKAPRAPKKAKTVLAKNVRVKRQTALDKVFPEIKMSPKEAEWHRRYWMNNVLRPAIAKMDVEAQGE